MNIAAVRRSLRGWYRREARDLPWRRARDPYHIWLSEIMLQQTRVEAALPYYERFVALFPTVAKLAAAPIDDVLKLWAGLGYYTRARNLHAAARTVIADFAGDFPRTRSALETLPGVGRYTAGAVASIAFGERVPVVDGNVKRVLVRLYGIETCVDDADTLDQLWSLAAEVVPLRNPGEFNQALMELGARICVPKRPRCGECPLVTRCLARRAGIETRLPVRRGKKAVPQVEAVAAAIEKGGRVLLVQRPLRGLLGGMWEFPGGERHGRGRRRGALADRVWDTVGLEVAVLEKLGMVEHVFSHRRLRLHVYRCAYLRGRVRRRWHMAARWVSLRKGRGAMRVARGLALASLDRKAVELLVGAE